MVFNANKFYNIVYALHRYKLLCVQGSVSREQWIVHLCRLFKIDLKNVRLALNLQMFFMIFSNNNGFGKWSENLRMFLRGTIGLKCFCETQPRSVCSV